MFNVVLARAVQDQLRRVFGLWGLPRWLRLDNGLPWGGWNDLPTALALWLAGLDVGLVFNPPRQPRSNGIVEKSHDTGQRWAEPETCASVAELQARLERRDRLYREVYPYRDGRSRVEQFPALGHSGRDYCLAGEEKHWSLVRAQQYLAGHVAVRRVSPRGQVSVYARNRGVGTRHQGKLIHVYYDPGSQEWVLAEPGGSTLRRLAAVEISRERICNLQVSARS